MARAVRAEPATLTMDVTWSPRGKVYVATLSYLAGSGRHGQRVVGYLENPARPPIDLDGTYALLGAIQQEYSGWLF